MSAAAAEPKDVCPFGLVETRLKVDDLLAEIDAAPDLWDRNRLRTAYPGSAHSQASDIWIRFNDTSTDEARSPAAIMNGLETHWYPASNRLPGVYPLIFLRNVIGRHLGRILITRLPDGAQIATHRDEGEYAAHHTRYQIMLRGPGDCEFWCDGVCASFKTGDAFRFDHTRLHTVCNHGPGERLALIVDVRREQRP